MTTEELKNAARFKAVDAEGNDLGVVTLSDIVTAVKEELAQSQPAARAASVSTLSEVSTLAATDTYEDQLPQKTDVNWVRGLDAEGNPVLISKQSLASVVEGLLPIAGLKSKGFTVPTFAMVSKGNNTVIKISPIISAWTYSYIIIQIYSNGYPVIVRLLLASHSDSNSHYCKKEGILLDRIIVKEDINHNVYIHNNTFGNWNYSISLIGNGNVENPTFNISSISKEEFESIETTDVKTFIE